MIHAHRPRVLFCSNAYPPRFIGGAELIVEKHARMLRRLGYEAAVFAGEGQEAWGPHHALRRDHYNDVPVWRIQLNHEDFANTGVNFVNRPVEQRFEEVLDDFRPTVVHCHNLIGLSVQLLHLAKRRGLRTGLTLHDHWMYCPRNTLVTPEGDSCDPRYPCGCQAALSGPGECTLPIFLRTGMMRTIAEQVDFFHFPSVYLRDIHMLWGLPADKCHAIPNGIELDRFAQVRREPSPNRVRLTFVGYMGHHKGVELLVEAFAGTPENDRLFLNLVGNGELRKPLTERVKELGIAGRVKFWKKVPNERICEVYTQTDCLVLPSLWPENHPVSINEALAGGIPVIASNSGGIPELVTHCKTGYLFEQGDQAELQRIFSHVARNPDCLDVLSENARRDSQRLSLNRSVSRMLDLYSSQSASSGTSCSASAGDPRPGAVGRDARPPGASVASRRVQASVTVACVGKRFDLTVLRTIREIEAGLLRSVIRMLWLDWLHKAQWDEIDVFWVVDSNAPLPAVSEMRKDAVLLVPESHRQATATQGTRCVVLSDDNSRTYSTIEAIVTQAAARGWHFTKAEEPPHTPLKAKHRHPSLSLL